MLLKRFILVLSGIFCAYHASAQLQGDLAQSRVLIILDRSSSMVQSWAGGREKARAADELIIKLVDSLYAVNPFVEVGLRVFGHQYPSAENNCYDSKMEVLFSKDVHTQMSLRLADLRPLGVTPIAYTLEQAARFDIVNESRNAYCVVLITDGGESCGGNICDVVNKFLNGKIHFKPYIVSLEDNAQLKTSYSCLGDYLQVLRQGDISPAVGTIVEAFRPMLKISNDDYKQMQNNTTSLPSVLKVNTPPITITPPKKDTVVKEPKQEKIVFTKPPEIIPGLINERLKLLAITPPAPVRLKPVELVPLPPLVLDTPAAKPEQLNRLQLAKPKTVVIAAPAPAKIKAMDRIPSITLVIDTPAVQRTKDNITKLTLARPKQFNVIFVIEDHIYAAVKVPALPEIKPEVVAVVPPPPPPPPPPVPKPVKKAEKEPKKGEYRTETEDAKETTVEIYFTNGKGKFYNSTPQVQLLDPGTNQMVKKFYRTIDESGNPDPQLHIMPGRYDIAFTESRGVIDKNVEVVAGKRNKIYVTVKNTSISFAYHDAPGRPVTEFSAVVTERNKPEGGRVQNQKCTELIEYEPGNYHIIINTFPEDRRNVDLDFNETEIEILQPGFAKFTSDGTGRNITLWRRLGDKFLQFYLLNINDPRSQHLQIQPGEYQVHYQKGPGQKSMSEKVVPFLIKATQETEVILK